MSRSIWTTVLERLDRISRHLCLICDESGESYEPCKPAEPGKSSQPIKPSHHCPRHPERTCDCDDDGDECYGDSDGDEWVRAYTDRANDYYDRIDRERNAEFVGQPYPVTSVPEYGQFECPVNGKACGSEFCTKGVCEESRSRAEAGKHWRFTKATYNH